MDDFLTALKYLIMGFVAGWLSEPVYKFSKGFWEGLKELVHDWNNPRGKDD